MKTPFVIMERSGISTQQKFQILTNELCRRISNLQVDGVPHQEVLETIEQFTQELKNSEYSRKQSREIIVSGLKGWKNKIRKRKRNNTPFYRLPQETVDERLKKHLVEKESWYKEKETEETGEEKSPTKYVRTNSGARLPKYGRRGCYKTNQEGVKNKIKSVIFVPHN